MSDEQRTRSNFDRILSGLHGLPDVTYTQPSTVRTVDFIGTSQTFIVTTYRMREQGDTVFLEMLAEDGQIRLAIPPKVADAIARQRDALTTKVRRKVGKANAADRAARGELPGFMKAGVRHPSKAKKKEGSK